MVEVRFTGIDIETLMNEIRVFGTATITVAPTLVVEKAASKREKKETVKADPTDTIQNGGKSEPAPVATAPVATAPVATAPVATAPVATAPVVPSEQFLELAGLVSQVVGKKGKPAAIALLAEEPFGVKKAGELKEAQYGAFIQRAKAVLAA